MDACSFHCLSYAHPARAAAMAARFRGLGMELAVSPGVAHADPRLAAAPDAGLRRLWSATYGHLDMLRAFLAGPKKYGVFCENDVLLAADFAARLPGALADFDALDLDLLLLGYMTGWPIEPSEAHPLLLARDEGAFLGYPADQWGAHMYVLSRRGARRALDAFADGAYAAASLRAPERAFSPDWTVTKLEAEGRGGRGRRALLFPMLAVEDGSDGIEHYGHAGQLAFHATTFEFNTRGRAFV